MCLMMCPKALRYKSQRPLNPVKIVYAKNLKWKLKVFFLPRSGEVRRMQEEAGGNQTPTDPWNSVRKDMIACCFSVKEMTPVSSILTT